MKIIAIDIESTKIIPFVIEVTPDGSFTAVDTGVKSIGIKDDYNNQELRDFTKEVYSYLDSINPTKIGIIKRQTKGKFSASSVSLSWKLLCNAMINVK